MDVFAASEAARERGIDGGIFELLDKIQRRALICTSNLDVGGNETVSNGIVHGHAYSKGCKRNHPRPNFHPHCLPLS